MATKGVLLCQRWEDGVIVNVTSFRFRAPLRPERPQSPPFHAHCSEPWLSHRRAWVLLMIMTLNYQYGSTRRVVRGPPSRSQSLAIGLLGQAADILLERYR